MGLLRLKVNGEYIDVARGPAGPIGPQGPEGPQGPPGADAVSGVSATDLTISGYKESVTNDTDTSVAVDFDGNNVVNCTGTGAVTVTWSNIPQGTSAIVPMTIRFASSVTSVIWPVGTKFAGGAAPTLSGETWVTAVGFNGVVTVGLAWDGVA